MSDEPAIQPEVPSSEPEVMVAVPVIARVPENVCPNCGHGYFGPIPALCYQCGQETGASE